MRGATHKIRPAGTRRAAALAALLAASFGATGAASAATCPFRQAVYTQKESRFVLRFADSRELGRFPGTSNAFHVDVPGREKPLLGWVIWNNGESRPSGSVMLDCPEDAMTNEDFAACTQWEGVLYALEGGDAKLLPGEDEPAPATILLPDFGRKIRYSDVGDIDNVPWDVFRFDRCAS